MAPEGEQQQGVPENGRATPLEKQARTGTCTSRYGAAPCGNARMLWHLEAGGTGSSVTPSPMDGQEAKIVSGWKWWGGRILLPAGPLPWAVCVTLLRTVFRDRSHEMCEAGCQIRELLRKLPRELLLILQGILDSAGRARPGEALLGGRETEGATAVLRRLVCCAYDGLRGFQRCG